LAWQALADSQFRHAVGKAADRIGPHRLGLIVGTSTSGIRSTEQAYASRVHEGQWPVSWSFRHMHAADALARFCAEVLELSGPVTAVTTACSSSAKAFLLAQRWIETGIVDAVVVGGVDSLCLSTLCGFHSLQLLSEEPCRPFDAERNGISIGEAAGFALLSRSPATVQLCGGGESSDAWHMSTPHPEGLGAQLAMRQALRSAGLVAGDIGYVNAHGTGTPANDKSEAAAIASVFGPYGVPVSSTKGVTGHTLGAAGIVEALVTIEVLLRQQLPASANLRAQDSDFALDIVTDTRPAQLRYAASNNFGFGGSNCTLIFGMTT
jgi:3-oxoacyl-[acyl-carrier-protein] synthase-1